MGAMRSSSIASAVVLATGLTVVEAQADPTSGCYSGPTAELSGAQSPGWDVDGAFQRTGIACSVPSGGVAGNPRWDTKAFIGFAFSFGTGGRSSHGGVHLTGGVRRTNISAENRVYGGEVHASVNLFKLDDLQIRALGLYGNRDVLGNAGVGLDVAGLQPVLSVGAQAPHARLMGDYYGFEKSVRAFIEANSYGRIARVVSASPSCAPGAVLSNEQEAATVVNNIFQKEIFRGGILAGEVMKYWYFNTDYYVSPIGLPSSNWVNGKTCFSGQATG